MTTGEDRSRAATRNTLALLASRVAVSALGWAGSVFIARMLSPTEWGQYSFVFGLLGLLSVVTDLGVGRVVLARLVDEDDPDVPLVASSFIALRVLLGLVGYAVAMLYVVLLDYPDEVVRATALAGVVVVIATPSHALTLLYQARLRLTVVAAAESLGQVLQLVLTVLAALHAPELLVFVLPVIANELVKIGIKVRGVRRGVTGARPARQVQLWRWRGMLIDAVPLTIGTALMTLLQKVDILLLSRLDTFESVGLYSVGYKFADVLGLVTWAVIGPALTLLMAAWPKDPEGFRARTRSTVLQLALLGSLAVTGFWAAAEPIITSLYGEGFGTATDAARLLVGGAALAMITQVGFSVLVATSRQRVYPYAGLIGLAVNVGLNLVLIPRMSFEGAALATVITEVLVFGTMWALVVRSVPIRRLLPAGGLGAVTASTAVIVALTTAVGDSVHWVLLAGASSCAAFGIGLALDLPGARHAVRALGRRAARRPR